MKDIKNFPLAWRWTSASHAVLPEAILATMTPLSDTETDILFTTSSSIEQRHRPSRSISTNIRPAMVSEFLATIVANPNDRVSVVWDRHTGLTMLWSTFTKHWDDFCYPSSDDVFILGFDSSFLVLYRHWEEMQVIQPNQAL